MKKKCASCIIYEGKTDKLIKENARLRGIIDVLNADLNDRTEWMENIKKQIVEMNAESKDIKDIVFKLKTKINKLT